MGHTIILPRNPKTKEAIIKLPDTVSNMLTVVIEGEIDTTYNKTPLDVTCSFGEFGECNAKIHNWEDVSGVDCYTGESVRYIIAYVSGDCARMLIERGLLVIFSADGRAYTDLGVYKIDYKDDEYARAQEGFDHLLVIKADD